MKSYLFNSFQSIDKNPNLIQFIQTPFGKLLGLMLFCFPLTFILPAIWPWIGLALGALMFLPNYRLTLLFLINICFWVVSPFLHWRILPYIHKLFGIDKWLFQGLIILSIILILSFILHLAKKTTYRNLAIIILLLFYVLCAQLAEFIPQTWIGHSLIFIMIWIFGKFFWFLIYAVIDIKKQDNVFSYIFSMQPFWALGLFLPVPGGLATMKKNEVYDEQYAVCQLKAIKLVYWISFISILLMLTSRLLIGYTLMSHPDVLTLGDSYLRDLIKKFPSIEIGNLLFHSHQELIDYALFRPHQIENPTQFLESAGRSFVFLFIFFSQILNINLVWIGTSVAIARMAGFYALRSVYKPHRADSFSEFWGRWVHYYKHLVLKVFFIPLYQFFQFIPSGKLRKIGSLFVALFLAGVFFHFDRIFRLQILDQSHSLSLLERWSRFLPYASAVAITVTLSRTTSNFNFFRGIVPRFIFIPFYLIILLVITALYFYIFSDITWHGFLQFLEINFFLNFLGQSQ